MMTGHVVILRLATGEDIVGTVSEHDTDYQVISPFKVIFRRFNTQRYGAVGLLLVPWLPSELLTEHTMSIGRSQVVCVMHPKQEFIDYYHRISDEMYMFMIEHDQLYRQQLTRLPNPFMDPSMSDSSFDDVFRTSLSEFSFRDDEDDNNEDADTEPPTRWH